MDRSPSTGEESFRALYQTHQRAILAYALRRTAQRADADEVVAETFLVAWRRPGDVPAEPDTLPWLYGVARGVLANLRRSGRRQHLLRERLAGLPIEAAELDVPAGDDSFRAIQCALRALKPDDLELIRLVAWEGLSHRQAAQVLGCSENAVAVRLHRIRRRLSVELGQQQHRARKRRDGTANPNTYPEGERDR